MNSSNKQSRILPIIRKLSVKSFRAKMIATYLLISIIPMLFSSIFFAYYLNNVVTKEIHTKERDVVNSNTVAIEYAIQRNVSSLEQITKNNPDVINGNKQGIVDYFAQIKYANLEVEEYGYVDEQDTAFTSSGSKLDVSDRDYVKKSRDTKQTVISDILVSKRTGNHIIVIFVPILDQQNNYKGGIFSTVTTENLDIFTDMIKIGETGFGYLVSSTGTLLNYPDKSLVGKNVNEILTPEQSAKLEAAAKKQTNGIVDVTDENGDKREISFNTIPSTGWRLISTVDYDEVYDSVETARTISIWLTIITAVVAAVFALTLSLGMTKLVSKLTDAVKKLATGDLTPRLQFYRKDELGQLALDFNYMVDSFSLIVGKASHAAEQVAASSEQLTATAMNSVTVSNHIAQSTQEVLRAGESQLQGAEQTSTAMGEMAVGVQRIAESSSAVTELSQDSLHEVQKGSVAIREAVEQMKLIHHSARRSAEDMQTLEGYSQQIGEIVTLITDITNQTNLLSLNASIEAARAGEQGRGFAVVANEVKKLSEQSTLAAANIGNLIREVQASTARAAAEMNQGVQNADRGSELINTAGQAFTQIASMFQEVSNQIQEVSAASQQMSAGTEQVTASMAEIVTMTDGSYRHTQRIGEGAGQQLQSMEEISSASEHLSSMAQELQEALSQFKTN
ncbi:methyl-accepting chemotaxis sensory transducer with Cache sensor [Paenibacillus cellulosilyticus]|uniref:Methyl-accepting chemotaxis sensory transducer with Cache sensor n=1 Tax=Paenibacillus cellulosilyticus TaxID=375489 RepID=A0A2V2YTE5_9BACL|nr:methyl-accepting chemotaxis protein [Paenibacillus cellulosilyticus]PWV98541.1 methyl-accepting chemotaxis sensory transducer with Cache sensor [Paenibacillus cellulosilyticus]QKS44147.1 methyl-accepting chemotaxis protein [Paenibacillus cellulosilyticus]